MRLYLYGRSATSLCLTSVLGENNISKKFYYDSKLHKELQNFNMLFKGHFSCSNSLFSVLIICDLSPFHSTNTDLHLLHVYCSRIHSCFL